MNVEEVGNDKGRGRMNDDKEMKVKRVRRGGKNRSLKEEITILYSNVQGFNGKKASLAEIFEVVNPDVCLLAETMVMKTKLDGCKAINPVKSIGQNVAIMVRNKFVNQKIMKIYEPNDVVNMMGIRLDIKNAGLRIYTAHLKQLSTNSKEEIKDQFEEIKNQFREANKGREGMVLVFDSNVHVGSSVIKD